MMKTNNQAEEYTRLKEGGTLTKCETVFFANPQDFGAGLPWFLGLLKLEFHSDSTKNTSLDITFVS